MTKTLLTVAALAMSSCGNAHPPSSNQSLRLLPPPNYDPTRFGLLLERIEALGVADVGLRLIGPNGPMGPEG